LRLGKHALGHLNACGPEGCHPSGPAAFQGAATCKHLTGVGLFCGKGAGPDGKARASPPVWSQIDMDEARAWIKAKPKEPDLSGGCFKRDGIMVCHLNIKRGPAHVLRIQCPFNRVVVLWAAIGRAQDQRLAEEVTQRLQFASAGPLSSSLSVPRQAISAGEKLRQRQACSGTLRQWA